MLVRLQEASDHLRRDTTDDDNDLTLKIKAASAAIINYLKSTSPYTPELDSSGEIVVDSNGDIVYEVDSAGHKIPLPEVKESVLYLLGIFYRDRDGQDVTNWEQGYLPFPVVALLNPLRNPALA
jgi:hypothetical protein